MYERTATGVHRSPSYNRWIRNFPNDQVPTKEEYEIYQGIDFSKPVNIDIQYIALPRFDKQNLNKAFLDQLFIRHFGLDDGDANIGNITCSKVATCDNYSEGKIIFALYQ